MDTPLEHRPLARSHIPSLGFRVRESLRGAPVLSWRSAFVMAAISGFVIAVAVSLADRLFVVAGLVLLVGTLAYRQTLARRSRDYFEGVWMGYSDVLDDLSERFYHADTEDPQRGTPAFFRKFFVARAMRDAGFLPNPEVVKQFGSLVLEAVGAFAAAWPDHAEGLLRSVRA